MTSSVAEGKTANTNLHRKKELHLKIYIFQHYRYVTITEFKIFSMKDAKARNVQITQTYSLQYLNTVARKITIIQYQNKIWFTCICIH